ncbi:hypothetical protein QBC46DRAFT_147792 [Diplogelasinospora grovesii]|uniref:Uncharacterized protein n=1 Tax=Diplogelasinospora grovesii TaxID=303347 RepID=A0AAN6NFK1_9PEZI|nr:hypothetical protein QBC46DRAFT_147792 [Diplogelasinospora grovesii]
MSDSPKDTMSPPGDLPQQIGQIRLSTPSTDAGQSSEANSNLDAASNRAQSLQVPSRSPSRPSHRSGSKTPDAGSMSNSQRSSSSSSQGLSLLQTELLGPPSADEVLRDLISPVMTDSSTTPTVFSKHGRKRSLDEDEDEDWLEDDNDDHHRHPRPWKRDRRDGLEEELDEMIAEQHFSSTSLLDSDDDDDEESEPKTPTGLDHPDPPENNNHNNRQTPEAGEGGEGAGTGGLEGVRRGPLPYRGARGRRQGPTDQSF